MGTIESEILETCDGLARSHRSYQTEIDSRVDNMERQLDQFSTAMNRTTTGRPPPNPRATTAESRAFQTFMRTGSDIELKALSVGVDPDGGYTTTPAVSARIIEKIFETSPLRSISAVETVSTDTLEYLVDKDEATASWVGEQSARPETASPQLAVKAIVAFEIYASPKATQKLLDDSSINIEEWLTSKVANKFSRTENAAFVNGTGTTQPRGFLTYPTSTLGDASRTWTEIQYTASGAAGAFAASDPSDALLDLVGTMNPGYLPNAWFVMPRSVLTQVRKFKDGDGNYIWRPGLQRGTPDTLLGFPVLLAEDVPAIAADSLSIAFGSFRDAYTIVDRHGMRVLRDPYTAKPHTIFYTYKRVGGDVVNYDAIKLMKFAAT